MIILYFHLLPQFKNELFYILHIKELKGEEKKITSKDSSRNTNVVRLLNLVTTYIKRLALFYICLWLPGFRVKERQELSLF